MSAYYRFLVLSVGMLLLCFAVVLAGGRRDKQSQGQELGIGLEAPNFKLKNQAGEVTTLRQYRGQVVVLAFWATWCPACREELPSLAGLHRRMAGQGVMVLGINGGESAARVNDFMNRANLDLPVLLDASGEVHGLYQVRQYPTTYIIDRQGKLVERHIGFHDWNAPEVAGALRSLAGNGSEVKP
ncbi:apocytochrome c disulfide reductase ResA [Syntrophotalea carbinolica DSM 2380]|uniref:Apocytochrome c disulfide reductase ResA n=1 Tax=Syntrophotalea carbinolica (strain DSM 2380 / NBRC 103641 / GraBd1) TaxID=338963 RepID=Q3A362_SYNC1|nr:TlpA disulfide reductase family protein [Syntrophotalea carbinolica]ABA89195.1 apocytochrome c disulfide reductase ResA [Syntrophotalea carbinolica DSM 2380]